MGFHHGPYYVLMSRWQDQIIPSSLFIGRLNEAQIKRYSMFKVSRMKCSVL